MTLNYPAFTTFSILSLISAIAQVALGGVVRVTDSGLGCPDWPLCHGQIIPPFEFTTMIEYSHRLSASLLILLVLVSTILAWKRLGNRHISTQFMIFASGLVLMAAILGGITVLTELKWWVVLIHLGIAESVVACIAIAIVNGNKPKNSESLPQLSNKPSWFMPVLITALVSTFLLILSGSYMVGLGYGSSCGTWPLCQGNILPTMEPFAVHMLHRYLALIVFLMVVMISAIGLTLFESPPTQRISGIILILFVIQILVGAGTVWSGFIPAFKSVHLTLATLVWATLVLMAATIIKENGAIVEKRAEHISYSPDSGKPVS